MKILLVDDHPLFREGLKLLLRQLAALDVDEADGCPQALELLARNAYDIVLLDLKLPGVTGFEALDAIRAVAPLPVVVLSGEESPQNVRAAIEAGAMGFVPKTARSEILIAALRLILAGGVYLPPAILAAPIPHAPAAASAAPLTNALAELSPRKLDVLRGIVAGKPNKVIARELGISDVTVKAHLDAVFRALGVHNRTEAVYAAARFGFQIT